MFHPVVETQSSLSGLLFPSLCSRLCNIWYPLHCYSSLWHARFAQTAELHRVGNKMNMAVHIKRLIFFFFSPPSLKSRIKVVAACGPGSIGWDDVKAVSFYKADTAAFPTADDLIPISYIPRTGQKVWIKQSSVWFISSHNREYYRL